MSDPTKAMTPGGAKARAQNRRPVVLPAIGRSKRKQVEPRELVPAPLGVVDGVELPSPLVRDLLDAPEEVSVVAVEAIEGEDSDGVGVGHEAMVSDFGAKVTVCLTPRKAVFVTADRGPVVIQFADEKLSLEVRVTGAGMDRVVELDLERMLPRGEHSFTVTHQFGAPTRKP